VTIIIKISYIVMKLEMHCGNLTMELVY